MPIPAAAKRRAKPNAVATRRGGRGAGALWSVGLVDCVILSPFVGRWMGADGCCSLNVRRPARGSVEPTAFTPGDAGAQVRGGARAWNIPWGVAADISARLAQGRLF